MILYAFTALLGALLLFLVQPLLGRFLLPWFGGGPTVWTTCMLFFQVGLLAGYAYAHLLALRLPTRRGVQLHVALALLSLVQLPLAPALHEAAHPTLGILVVLGLAVALPYLALASTAPLLQRWFTRVARGREPYRLYAWSNAGSLLALLAYPVAVEPWLGREAQTRLWSAGYLAFLVLIGLCAARAWRAEPLPAAQVEAAPAPTRGQRAIWLATTTLSSALMLAVTDALTETIGATPLLWVLPLAIFLLSFILAFAGERWAPRLLFGPLMVPALLATAWVLGEGPGVDLLVEGAVLSATLFVFCMALHGELVRARPHPEHLTGFYLATAVGGALGGLFVGVLAPRLLPVPLELELCLVAAPLLVGSVVWRQRRRRALFQDPQWMWVAVALLLLGYAAHLGWTVYAKVGDALWIRRGFFGTVRVEFTPASRPHGPARRLYHGAIVHGRQFTDERRFEARTYYGPDSGAALALTPDGPPRRVGVVGLGIGSLAAYGRAGDHFVFYEIDPNVVQAAREWFTFLADCAARTEVVLGDARLSLAREAGPRYDVLVLDAFSADAIPAHLLTREALQLYLRRLAPDGVLLFNVSNRHVDLQPVLRDHGAALGLEVAEVLNHDDRDAGIFRARWMLLTRDPAKAARFAEVADEPDTADRLAWTDDFAPLLPLLRTLRR